MINETPMADMLEEDHVLGDLPLDNPGDLCLGDIGVQANQDGKRCFRREYEFLKTK